MSPTEFFNQLKEKESIDNKVSCFDKEEALRAISVLRRIIRRSNHEYSVYAESHLSNITDFVNIYIK